MATNLRFSTRGQSNAVKDALTDRTATSVSYFEVLTSISEIFYVNCRHKFVTTL